MGEIVDQKPDNSEDLDPGLGDPPFTELRGGWGGWGRRARVKFLSDRAVRRTPLRRGAPAG